MEGELSANRPRHFIISRPARSPLTPAMRLRWCAASRPKAKSPFSSLLNGTPKSSKSCRRSAASCASRAAMVSSTRPSPALIVSSACNAGVSSAPIAAAMPPCAQKLDDPLRVFADAISVTGRWLSFNAVYNPANPAPTTSTSPASMIFVGVITIKY